MVIGTVFKKTTVTRLRALHAFVRIHVAVREIASAGDVGAARGGRLTGMVYAFIRRVIAVSRGPALHA